MKYAPENFKTSLVQIRPMYETDTGYNSTYLLEAEMIGIYTSDGTFPSTFLDSFGSFAAALAEATRLCANNIWYTGAEVLCKIEDLSELWAELAENTGEEIFTVEKASELRKLLGFET